MAWSHGPMVLWSYLAPVLPPLVARVARVAWMLTRGSTSIGAPLPWGASLSRGASRRPPAALITARKTGPPTSVLQQRVQCRGVASRAPRVAPRGALVAWGALWRVLSIALVARVAGVLPWCRPPRPPHVAAIGLGPPSRRPPVRGGRLRPSRRHPLLEVGRAGRRAPVGQLLLFVRSVGCVLPSCRLHPRHLPPGRWRPGPLAGIASATPPTPPPTSRPHPPPSSLPPLRSSSPPVTPLLLFPLRPARRGSQATAISNSERRIAPPAGSSRTSTTGGRRPEDAGRTTS